MKLIQFDPLHQAAKAAVRHNLEHNDEVSILGVFKQFEPAPTRVWMIEQR